jgi:hypothetical protein
MEEEREVFSKPLKSETRVAWTWRVWTGKMSDTPGNDSWQQLSKIVKETPPKVGPMTGRFKAQIEAFWRGNSENGHKQVTSDYGHRQTSEYGK